MADCDAKDPLCRVQKLLEQLVKHDYLFDVAQIITAEGLHQWMVCNNVDIHISVKDFTEVVELYGGYPALQKTMVWAYSQQEVFMFDYQDLYRKFVFHGILPSSGFNVRDVGDWMLDNDIWKLNAPIDDGSLYKERISRKIGCLEALPALIQKRTQERTTGEGEGVGPKALFEKLLAGDFLSRREEVTLDTFEGWMRCVPGLDPGIAWERFKVMIEYVYGTEWDNAGYVTKPGLVKKVFSDVLRKRYNRKLMRSHPLAKFKWANSYFAELVSRELLSASARPIAFEAWCKKYNVNHDNCNVDDLVAAIGRCGKGYTWQDFNRDLAMLSEECKRNEENGQPQHYFLQSTCFLRNFMLPLPKKKGQGHAPPARATPAASQTSAQREHTRIRLCWKAIKENKWNVKDLHPNMIKYWLDVAQIRHLINSPDITDEKTVETFLEVVHAKGGWEKVHPMIMKAADV